MKFDSVDLARQHSLTLVPVIFSRPTARRPCSSTPWCSTDACATKSCNAAARWATPSTCPARRHPRLRRAGNDGLAYDYAATNRLRAVDAQRTAGPARTRHRLRRLRRGRRVAAAGRHPALQRAAVRDGRRRAAPRGDREDALRRPQPPACTTARTATACCPPTRTTSASWTPYRPPSTW